MKVDDDDDDDDWTHRSRGCVDDFLRRQITFVAYEKFIYIFTCVAFDLLQPLFHIVE